MQHLSPVPGLVQGLGSDAGALGHACACCDGNHEAGKQFRRRRAPTSCLPFVGYPVGRVSPSYGYAQAQPPAWRDFESSMGSSGSRDNFADAIMFIGWYTAGTQRQLGISKWDTYNQYLAYHEGRGGYSRNTYRAKPWLMQVARKVEQQSKTYGAQLGQCRGELEKGRRSFWPF